MKTMRFIGAGILLLLIAFWCSAAAGENPANGNRHAIGQVAKYHAAQIQAIDVQLAQPQQWSNTQLRELLPAIFVARDYGRMAPLPEFWRNFTPDVINPPGPPRAPLPLPIYD